MNTYIFHKNIFQYFISYFIHKYTDKILKYVTYGDLKKYLFESKYLVAMLLKDIQEEKLFSNIKINYMRKFIIHISTTLVEEDYYFGILISDSYPIEDEDYNNEFEDCIHDKALDFIEGNKKITNVICSELNLNLEKSIEDWITFYNNVDQFIVYNVKEVKSEEDLEEFNKLEQITLPD